MTLVLNGCKTWSVTFRQELGLRVFEHRCRGRYLDRRGRSHQGNGGNSKVRSLIICTPGDKLEGDRAVNVTHVGGGEAHSETVIVKLILKVPGGRPWTRLIWCGIWTSGRLSNFIVAPCILKIHWVLHNIECTNYILCISLKFITLKHLKCSYMFRFLDHPQGTIRAPCGWSKDRNM
jgi:hypothetical protein